MKQIEIDGWVVKATTDDDGHLIVSVDHSNDTEVFDTGMDVSQDDNQWAGRFSTDEIEERYMESIDSQGVTSCK